MTVGERLVPEAVSLGLPLPGRGLGGRRETDRLTLLIICGFYIWEFTCSLKFTYELEAKISPCFAFTDFPDVRKVAKISG